MKNNFILRTMLFVPAHKDKLIEKAAACNADALVLDLEDSCRPLHMKPAGRDNIVKALKCKIFGKKKIFVRVNPRLTTYMFDDLYVTAIPELDGYLYPMAGTHDDITFFANLLSEIEMARGIPQGHFKIFPVIETGEGILNAHEIAHASERVVALGFGSEDFATDIGCVRDAENVSIQIPRQRVVFAARSAGAIPIDTPHVDVHNIPSLERHISQARILGFGGMQILHPKEIELCHQYYTPSLDEAEEAYEIIKLFERAQEEGGGVAILNDRFISPPTFKRAEKLVEYYETLKKFDEE